MHNMSSTRLYWFCVLLSTMCWHSSSAGTLYGHEDPSKNMVRNWGFEDELSSSTDWRVFSGKADRLSEAAHDGSNFGVKVYDRTSRDGGVTQRVYFGADQPNLKRGQDLYFSAFIKFVTNPDPPEKYIRVKYMYRFVYDNTAYNYQGSVARLSFERVDGSWNQVGGDLAGPPLDRPDPRYIDLFMRVEPYENVDYYLDSFALTNIDVYGDDWKSILGARISKNRKTTVRITTKLPSSINVTQARISIKMIRHKFNWGTSIGRGQLTGSGQFNINFRKFLKDSMFNWLCYTSAMNWLRFEPTKYSPNLNGLKAGTDWMLDNGFKIRGHSVLWEIMEANPAWLFTKVGQNMKDHVMRRVRYMVENWKDEMYEWDMCNEFVHQHFYEQRAGVLDQSLLAEEFDLAYSIDPKAKLCINDYSVLRDSQYTSAQANLAQKLQEMDVPVSCMGAQGHMRNVDPRAFSVGRFLKRLEIISVPGLPISLSELSVHAPNDTYRADILEKILYSIYSEPLVSGAILWGVSDNPGLFFTDDTTLVEGIDFVPNKAGTVLLDLLKTTWTSKAYYRHTRSVRNRWLRLYHGKYKMVLSVNNQVHDTRYFNVNPMENNEKLRVIKIFDP